MGKHLDKLKTGDPNRKVSNQELINVLGGYFQESTEILKRLHKPSKTNLTRAKYNAFYEAKGVEGSNK